LNILWYSYRYGITPTPTSFKVQKEIVALLPKHINGRIVELGSGWGSLTAALARFYPGQQIEAYEISLIPYYFSKVFFYLINLKNIKEERRNFFEMSLKESSLIVCYLYPGAMEKLQVKFEQELSTGTYILSHTFAVPGWKPLQVSYVKDIYLTPIFLYRV
jgi:hypothetical protein